MKNAMLAAVLFIVMPHEGVIVHKGDKFPSWFDRALGVVAPDDCRAGGNFRLIDEGGTRHDVIIVPLGGKPNYLFWCGGQHK